MAITEKYSVYVTKAHTGREPHKQEGLDRGEKIIGEKGGEALIPLGSSHS